MTSIIEHGSWVRYTPDKLPEHAPPNALFARREGDQADWYDYVNSDDKFYIDSVKFTAQQINGQWIVGAATTDGTALFPADGLVGEITGYYGEDPQAEFGGKVYDPAAGTFTAPPPPQAPEPIEAMITRIVRAELKKGA